MINSYTNDLVKVFETPNEVVLAVATPISTSIREAIIGVLESFNGYVDSKARARRLSGYLERPIKDHFYLHISRTGWSTSDFSFASYKAYYTRTYGNALIGHTEATRRLTRKYTSIDYL